MKLIITFDLLNYLITRITSVKSVTSLVDALQVLCDGDVYKMENERYSIDYRLIHGDVRLPQNALKTPQFVPHGKW